jgi:two-component system chemotaxis response regulator CheY
MSLNILVVDDCDTTRKIITYMIKGAGYSAVNAVNGMDALEKLAQNEIALVVTDLNMPHMDGFELVKNMKENPAYGEIPVIMITTEGGSAKEELGMNAGVDIFMSKPVTSKWLAYQIQKLI